LVALVGSDGPDATVTVGATVSMVQAQVASTPALPAPSAAARTWKVWAPSASPL
jgi:hypothetical protein